jgi:hypothetical protein
MSFNLANLTPVQFVAGNQLLPIVWDYSTSDNIADVEVSTYFDAAAKNLRIGDIIRVTANDGKAIYYVDGTTVVTPDVGITKMATVSAFI